MRSVVSQDSVEQPKRGPIRSLGDMQPALPLQPPDASPLCPCCPAPIKVGVHSRQHGRSRCHACRKTFTQSYGTPLHGLKTDLNVVVLIMTLLIFGCPLPAIVMAFKLDERTSVADNSGFLPF